MTEKPNLLNKIEQLKLDLYSLGYSRMQLSHILNEASGNKKPDQLTVEQLEKLIDTLEAQIAFAKKCKNII